MNNDSINSILTHFSDEIKENGLSTGNLNILDDWLKSGLPFDTAINQHAGLIQRVRDNWHSRGKLSLQLEIDGEWYGDKLQPISLQVAEFADRGQRWQRFYEHPNWRGKKQFPTWKGETVLEDILGTVGFQSKPDNCTKGKPLVITLAIFFSEGDIRLFLGDRIARELFGNAKLIRRAYLLTYNPVPLSYWLAKDGVARQVLIDLVDLSGYRKSLLETARELNITMPSKTSLDNYKTCMNTAYEQLPVEFIQYAMGDLVLYQIHEARLIKQNMCYQILGLSERNHPAMSPGRHVNDLFIHWLEEKIKVSKKVVEHLSLIQNGDSSKNDNYLKLLLQQASVVNLLDTDSELTTRYLALVHGGRARNESAATISHRGLVVSADLSGAYSTTMKQMTYPIGLPTIVSFPINEAKQWMTLDKMLHNYSAELIDNLWVAVVETSEPLSFDQDVIFSKTNVKLTRREVMNSWDDYVNDQAGIQADFGLFTRELENAILTSSTLHLLKNVATSTEWAELKRKIRVKSLMFYPKSDRCTTFAEWEEKVLVGGVLSTKGNRSNHGNDKRDDRSRAWFGIKLSDFLNPFVNQRETLKYLRDREVYASDAFKELDAQQESIKLIINTLFGVICSPYFPVNNVLIANNITALVRDVCWCMVKASNGKTAITDGSEALLNSFAFLNYPQGRKAGLNIFAHANDYAALDRNTRKYFKLKPLGNKGKWKLVNSMTLKNNSDIEHSLSNDEVIVTGRKDSWSEINQLYKQHMLEFWKSYYLPFLSNFDYSMKDVYQDLVLLNVANYGMKKLSGETYVKVRGTKLEEPIEGYVIHPRSQLYQHILESQPVYPVPLYVSKQLIKVDGWRNNRSLREQYLPADTYKQTKYSALFTASQFTYKTKEDHKWWLEHEDKLKNKTGYGLEYYALSDDGTIAIDRAKEIQRLIDLGERPYLPRKPLLRPHYEEWQNRKLA